MAYWPDTGTGVDAQPARKPVQSALRKYFTEGGVGQAPTVPGGDWFNQMTNEILNVLEAAGIEPSKVDDDQLFQAIITILDKLREELASSTPGNGAQMIGYKSAGLSSPEKTLHSALRELEPSAIFDSNNGFVGIAELSSSMMILGDSITEGAGASSYPKAYAYQVARSILNHRNKGEQNDPGYGWHTDINQANAVNTGLTSSGTLLATGLVASRRSLAPGQSITVNNRAFNSVYVVYDASSSSGSLVIARNGVTLSTQAVGGTGLKETAEVANSWSETDTLTISAAGGTIVVCGVLTLKSSPSSSLLYVAGKSGYAYQDYITTSALDEISYWLNLFREGNEKVLVLNLGTNNLYNPGRVLTPTEMTVKISSLIDGVNSRCSSVRFVISIPPRADATQFPILSPGVNYEDYVAAIFNFAKSNGHGLLRHDQSILSRNAELYSDGVHPSNVGHRVMAKTVCDSLGVTLNPYVRTALPSGGEIQSDIPMNDAWGAYTGSSALRAKAHRVGNIVTLSGIVQPNGSSSLVLGTLPVGYRPTGRTCYMCGRNNVGPIGVNVDTSGVITLLSASAWFSLEGVTFVANRT